MSSEILKLTKQIISSHRQSVEALSLTGDKLHNAKRTEARIIKLCQRIETNSRAEESLFAWKKNSKNRNQSLKSQIVDLLNSLPVRRGRPKKGELPNGYISLKDIYKAMGAGHRAIQAEIRSIMNTNCLVNGIFERSLEYRGCYRLRKVA